MTFYLVLFWFDLKLVNFRMNFFMSFLIDTIKRYSRSLNQRLSHMTLELFLHLFMVIQQVSTRLGNLKPFRVLRLVRVPPLRDQSFILEVIRRHAAIKVSILELMWRLLLLGELGLVAHQRGFLPLHHLQSFLHL